MKMMSSHEQTVRKQGWVGRFAWYKVGAITYILWGLWHLRVVACLWQFGATLAEPAGVGVRLQQGAFHILFFAVCAIAVGFLNWRNSRIGYWINLFAITWTEIGLFLLFILPGTFPWLPTGWVGPALWVVAVVFTTLGLLRNSQTP
ncbi:hypothetical protein S7335_383 [Synechococcus sp. PCC 7335]|nr:hypothetical protein S7335_180 [Synechococcus sp. PCC 7335]EDX83204.1 hypothetical protein S7335_383 [Synechococcus sp. PCC 7335]